MVKLPTFVLCMVGKAILRWFATSAKQYGVTLEQNVVEANNECKILYRNNVQRLVGLCGWCLLGLSS